MKYCRVLMAGEERDGYWRVLEPMRSLDGHGFAVNLDCVDEQNAPEMAGAIARWLYSWRCWVLDFLGSGEDVLGTVTIEVWQVLGTFHSVGEGTFGEEGGEVLMGLVDIEIKPDAILDKDFLDVVLPFTPGVEE